jgi:hypothetical protein
MQPHAPRCGPDRDEATLTTPTPETRTTTLRVVVDADVSLPPTIVERLGIVVAPEDATLLLARESIPRLMVDVGAPLEAGPVVAAVRHAAQDGSDVLYVGPGDGHGHPEGVEPEVRTAVEAHGGRLHLVVDDVLMASGWRAVVAAEAVAEGAPVEDAVRRARDAETQLIALIEHPELSGQQAPGNLGVPNRMVSIVRADGFVMDSLPPRREDALRLLRDRFAASAQGRAGLRVVVHHGGVGPAGEAMATWIERHLAPREVHVTAITRHAATRFGPGFVGIAWTAEPAG